MGKSQGHRQRLKRRLEGVTNPIQSQQAFGPLLPFGTPKSFRREEEKCRLLEIPLPVMENLLEIISNENFGGPKSLLNLRKVCRTTRNWVNFLRPPLKQKLFSHCIVRLDSKTFQEFMSSKVSLPVTVFRLYEVPFWSWLIKRYSSTWTDFLSNRVPHMTSIDFRNFHQFMNKNAVLEIIRASSDSLQTVAFTASCFNTKTFVSENRLSPFPQPINLSLGNDNSSVKNNSTSVSLYFHQVFLEDFDGTECSFWADMMVIMNSSIRNAVAKKFGDDRRVSLTFHISQDISTHTQEIQQRQKNSRESQTVVHFTFKKV